MPGGTISRPGHPGVWLGLTRRSSGPLAASHLRGPRLTTTAQLDHLLSSVSQYYRVSPGAGGYSGDGSRSRWLESIAAGRGDVGTVRDFLSAPADVASSTWAGLVGPVGAVSGARSRSASRTTPPLPGAPADRALRLRWSPYGSSARALGSVPSGGGSLQRALAWSTLLSLSGTRVDQTGTGCNQLQQARAKKEGFMASCAHKAH